MCRIVSQDSIYVGEVLTPRNVISYLKMVSEGSRPQFSKLGHTTKMALQVYSSNFFHSKRIKIDDKQYNDPIRIISSLGKD
jgi:hypothetical protein